MKLAAIDIGSNAARLLITEVIKDEKENVSFNKVTLVRVPLRLGFDVFETGEISPKKIGLFLETMKAFNHLLNAFEVNHFKACATSAMREAINAKEITRIIKKETGIKIDVISGSQEASYVFENHIAENLDKNKSYLYIDVGGGSTELTFYSKNKMVFKHSFEIGTIRLLKNKVKEEHWDEMKEFIKKRTQNYGEVTAIGSGGNINKVYSLSNRKDNKALPIELLRNYYKNIGSLSLAERMAEYNLKDDRADVIIPALQIYINVMKWADAEEIYVPKIGLVDGLVQHLWKEINK
ncbi:MAG: exopolyphosphatase [Ginsengibacter sp.]